MKNSIALFTGSFQNKIFQIFMFCFCICSLGTGSVQAQNLADYKHSYDAIINYDPSEYNQNGYELKIRVFGFIDDFVGDPLYNLLATVEKVEGRIYLNGQWYNESDFEEKLLDQIKVGLPSYTLDIYDVVIKISTMKATRVLDWEVPKGCRWDELWDGVSSDRAKDLYLNGFQIKNFRLVDHDKIQYGFYSILQHLEDKEKKEQQAQEDKANFNTNLQKANDAEQAGNLNNAITQYETALTIEPDNHLVKERLNMLKEKVSQIDELMAKGDRYFNEKKWDSAEHFFKQVIEIDPNHSRAQNRLARIEKNREEEKKQAWETKKEKEQKEREQYKKERMAADVAVASTTLGLMIINIGEDNPVGVLTGYM
jgi:tetratricopeptide (TPR) repeat protein